jgi:SAM-dependent methyltransferase
MSQTKYTTVNSDYLKNNPSWHTEDSEWKATQIIKMISRNNLVVKSIAEIGCGGGEILNQLHERLQDKNIYLTGYDIAPDAINICQRQTKPRLNFYQEDLTTKESFFDLLLMLDVFEHVEDYMGFIRKASAKATYSIFHIPLDMSIIGLLRDMPIRDRGNLGHLHYFMKETALTTLTDCGLEVIDYFYTPGSLEAGTISFKARVLNIFRKPLFLINQDLTVKLLSGYSLMVLTKNTQDDFL